MNRILDNVYSCKGTALAAANYLKAYGYAAEPKFLNGIWRVVVHETEGDYWHREIRRMNKIRRKALEEIRTKIEDVKSDLEMLRDEEQEYIDNMPENAAQNMIRRPHHEA